MTDIGEPGLFDNDSGAASLHYTSAFGIPVRQGSEPIGVMTFFSRQRLFANDVFLRVLTQIGSLIGSAVIRLEDEKHEERLAAITASSHDAIFSQDLEGRVTEWLPGAERLFGYPADDIVSQPVSRLIPPEQQDRHRQIMDQVVAGGMIEPYETQRLTSDGRLIEVSVRSSAIRASAGSIVGVSSTERDISRLKETERRLRSADQQKDEFLAMLGHELRNPLSTILSSAELLKYIAADDPKLRDTQEVLERQSLHMSRLLDGLIDVSRIVNGKIELETTTVDLVDVCREVLSDTSTRLEEKALTLHADLPDRPMFVDGDRIRLVQIVDNLLSNAVRYSQPGGPITVQLEVVDGQARLRVADQGIGIDPELLPHVFDVFWQSRQSLDRRHGGLGIGLSLVRALAELHGGAVEAHSDGPGTGATFVFRMRANQSASLEPDHDHDGAPKPLDILLIEDNADSADLIVKLLQRYGHRVTARYDGTSGIAFAREQRPDVVICDLGLPDEVTGFDVAEALRSQERTAGIQLIALTGYGGPDMKQRCLDAGYAMHLTKPISARALAEAIGRRVSCAND